MNAVNNVEIIESPKTADIGLWASVTFNTRRNDFFLVCHDADEEPVVFMARYPTYAEAFNRARQFVTEEA